MLFRALFHTYNSVCFCTCAYISGYHSSPLSSLCGWCIIIKQRTDLLRAYAPLYMLLGFYDGFLISWSFRCLRRVGDECFDETSKHSSSGWLILVHVDVLHQQTREQELTLTMEPVCSPETSKHSPNTWCGDPNFSFLLDIHAAYMGLLPFFVWVWILLRCCAEFLSVVQLFGCFFATCGVWESTRFWIV